MSKIRGEKDKFLLFKKRVLPLGLEQEQEDIKQLQILRGKKDRNFFGPSNPLGRAPTKTNQETLPLFLDWNKSPKFLL